MVAAIAAPTPADAATQTFSQVTGQNLYPCGGLCVLGSSGRSVSVTGSGSLFASYPGMMVDSTGSPAVAMTSTGNIVVGSPTTYYFRPPPVVGVTGTAASSIQAVGSGTVRGTVAASLQPTPDPLAGLSGMAFPVMPGPARSVQLSLNQSETISPGVYSGIDMASSGQLTLQPGVYVVTKHFHFSGSGTISGTGVTLYFACSSYPEPCPSGTKGAALDVTGTGFMYLTPPPTNPSCLGLSVVYDPNNSSSVDIPAAGDPSVPGSGSIRLDGILYDPSGSFNLTGAGSVAVGAAVVDSVKLSNSGSLLVEPDLSADVCNLQFERSGEPTTALTNEPIPGGATDSYMPGSPNPIAVDAVDGDGNLMTGYNGPVTLSLAPGTGTSGADLNGTVTVDAVDGVAKFSGLSVDASGTLYLMKATANRFNDGVSDGFTVFPQSGQCEAQPMGSPGATCSASASAFDGTETAQVTYTNGTQDPEYALIAVTPTSAINACLHTTNGPANSVTTAIYDATTGLEDSTSQATVDETIPAAFVPPPPTNPNTGVPQYVVCYASFTPFTPAPGWGGSGQVIGDQVLELGVLDQCGAPSGGGPPPGGGGGAPPPGNPGSGPGGAPPPPPPTVGPPCMNFDHLNGDGSLSAEWITAGDPVGRGA